jgi:hypothetical protein
MGKITFKGFVPPDDPMFSGTYQVFSPHGSRRLTEHSHQGTASSATKTLSKNSGHSKGQHRQQGK